MLDRHTQEMERARAKVSIWQNRLDDIYDETIMKMKLETQP